jgi:probable F420-dependent oxidoreductase
MSRPRLRPQGVAVGLGTPIVISFPGKTPEWATRATPRDLTRLAQAADRLGYAYLTVSDHIVVPRKAVAMMGATWFAPFPTLAYIAASTERIGLCTHIVVVPYRHPLVAARDIGTLDHLSGGRLILGVGTGHLRAEFRALGINHDDRGAITDSYLDELARIWRDESDYVVAPSPVQAGGPRVWIGGNTPRALRRAVGVADGWVPWQIELSRLRSLIDAHGHPGEVAYPATFDTQGVNGQAQSADACLAVLHELRQAGVTAVTAGFPSRSLDELIAQLEAFSTQVLPHCAALD